MSRVFTRGDEAVEAGANQSFLLDVGGVWFVERGWIDVFCMRLAAGGTVADRLHIARVSAGRCLFGDGGGDVGDGDSAEGSEYENDSRTVLQAVGSAGTKVRFLGEGAARARFEEGRAARGGCAADRWLGRCDLRRTGHRSDAAEL